MAEAASARPMDKKQFPAALVASKFDLHDNSSPWQQRRAIAPLLRPRHDAPGGAKPRLNPPYS